MAWKHIVTVYLKELKDSLRDRRTIISTIVIPTLAMPILIFGFIVVIRKIDQRAQSQSSTVMVLGVPDSSPIVTALKEARDEDQKRALFRVLPAAENYRQLISDKKIKAALELPGNFEAALQAAEPFKVTIYNYQGEMTSGLAVRRLQDFFGKLREKTVEARLVERALPASLVKPFDVTRQNVAPPEKVGGNSFGGLIPYLIIILCFTGAMYPAIDLTAGEKERGTMETLLCSPVHRLNIVLGKFLMVFTASVTTVLLSLVSMGVSTFFGLMYFGGGAKAQVVQPGARTAAENMLPTIDPLGLVGVFAMAMPVAMFFAAVLLAISLFAKSFKEAQSYVSPLVMVIIMPAVIGMLPGVELNSGLALIPILNVSLVSKELVSGVWHWNYIALIFGSSCVYAAAALGFAVRMFNREDVIFRT